MWIDHKAIFLVELLLNTLLEKDIGDGSRGCSKDLPYRLTFHVACVFLMLFQDRHQLFLDFLYVPLAFDNSILSDISIKISDLYIGKVSDL